jgi:RNA polymerase sigma-70 factor (ECF subfamily)
MYEQLVVKAKTGDTRAFTELIHCIENDLYRIAKTRLRNDDEIGDAIQETMIIAYKKIKKLKDNFKFKTWIIKILINECNLIYKKRKRQNNVYERMENNNILKDEDNIIHNINSMLDFELLINKLNYEERLIITLFYNSQYSCSEISEILNMNINTVKSKLKRAKDKIKNYCKGGMIYE